MAAALLQMQDEAAGETRQLLEVLAQGRALSEAEAGDVLRLLELWPKEAGGSCRTPKAARARVARRTPPTCMPRNESRTNAPPGERVRNGRLRPLPLAPKARPPGSA